MAAFTGEPDETVRLDYRILQNGAVCLYFRPHILDEDVDWLRQQTYDVHEFDCARLTSEAEFHTAVSDSLSFPDWYGRNLHAFNDSLSDIVVPDEGGSALVFRRPLCGARFDRRVARPRHNREQFASVLALREAINRIGAVG